MSCTFSAADGRAHFETCAESISDDEYQISPAVLKTIEFESNGLAGGSITGDGCFWVKRDGRAKRTFCFDNGADYFSSGLARFVSRDQKFGFMNRKLKTVIKAQYTFAFPFEKGLARVCQNCQVKRVRETENSILDGGEWSIIDKSGRIVTRCPGAKSYDECRPPTRAKPRSKAKAS